MQSPVEERKLEKSAGYMLIGTKKPQQCLLSNEKNWLKWIFYHNKKRYEWLYEIEKSAQQRQIIDSGAGVWKTMDDNENYKIMIKMKKEHERSVCTGDIKIFDKQEKCWIYYTKFKEKKNMGV